MLLLTCIHACHWTVQALAFDFQHQTRSFFVHYVVLLPVLSFMHAAERLLCSRHDRSSASCELLRRTFKAWLSTQ